MNVADMSVLFLTRLLAVMTVCAIFLPPDAQNPHLYAGAFMQISGAFFWAVGDIAAHDLRHKQ